MESNDSNSTNKPIETSIPVETNTPIEASTPVETNEPIESSKPVEAASSSKGLKIATAVASVIAVCGIAFGIYGMIQSSQKDTQISDLKIQVKNTGETISPIETPKTETTTDDSTTTVIPDQIAEYRNRIITSSNPNESYYTYFDSDPVYTGSKNIILSITLLDGDIKECNIGVKTSEGIAYGETAGGRRCEISGLNKKIYKVITFGEGQDRSLFNVGFIMEDGSIQYFSLGEIENSSSFNAEKTLKLDKYITNAVSVNAVENNYGYTKTIFITNDGSLINFSTSML